MEVVQPGLRRGTLQIRCLRRHTYWQEDGALRRGGRGAKRRAWSMVCCFTRFQALGCSAVRSREHARGSADVQRPSEMLKGLQSPLHDSSHPVPSLGTSEMPRHIFPRAAAPVPITLPNAVLQGDRGETCLWSQKGKIQAAAPRSFLVCLESLTCL